MEGERRGGYRLSGGEVAIWLRVDGCGLRVAGCGLRVESKKSLQLAVAVGRKNKIEVEGSKLKVEKRTKSQEPRIKTKSYGFGVMSS